MALRCFSVWKDTHERALCLSTLTAAITFIATWYALSHKAQAAYTDILEKHQIILWYFVRCSQNSNKLDYDNITPDNVYYKHREKILKKRKNKNKNYPWKKIV